ncbi:MAG: nucleotidyltransferase domain-containing protein [Candidatus Gastranaerophilaceae bacterium]|jgi:predicted nucleotidyltransferase
MSDKTLEKIIEKILEVIIPDKIILFGSRARGEACSDSDYDILIIKDGIENERQISKRLYVQFVGINESIDIIVKTPNSIEKSKKIPSSCINTAIKEGVVVYG